MSINWSAPKRQKLFHFIPLNAHVQNQMLALRLSYQVPLLHLYFFQLCTLFSSVERSTYLVLINVVFNSDFDITITTISKRTYWTFLWEYPPQKVLVRHEIDNPRWQSEAFLIAPWHHLIQIATSGRQCLVAAASGKWVLGQCSLPGLFQPILCFKNINEKGKIWNCWRTIIITFLQNILKLRL